jgi:endogenous inhibitor of DNA gyrase (YacG/DUF329 family)
MNVQCPTCKKEVIWSEAYPYRPFCSERCKLIDLGAWAMEKHAIPDEESSLDKIPDDSDEDSEK